jgi:hypothetical protein
MISAEKSSVLHNDDQFSQQIPTNDLSLYDALRASYNQSDENIRKLKDKGYNYDSELSNHNQQVFYRPTDKKLLFTVAGTHNLADARTDVYLGLGKLQDTDRFKESKNKFDQAKKKYTPTNTSVVGHSLGGAISQYLTNEQNDTVYTLDKGATIGQPTRNNEKAYRSSGDGVSFLGSGITTLKNDNKNKYYKWGRLFGPVGRVLGWGKDTLDAHNVSNVKEEPIFV